MQKVKLEKVYRTTQDKNGNPLVTKQGKPYTRVSIKVADSEYADRWISGFGNSANATWKDGDEVEVAITANGDYLNFEMPREKKVTRDEFDALVTRVKNLEAQNLPVPDDAPVEEEMSDVDY